MLAFFWFVVIAIVIAGWVYYQQQASRKPKPQDPNSIPRNLFNLQVGDIVQYLGIDWIVEGQVFYDEDGFTWQEYLLQDGDRIAWLSVEEDDFLVVSILEPTKDLELTSEPPEELFFADGGKEGLLLNYQRVGSGKARMTRSLSASGRTQVLDCQYFDYEGPAERVLSVENWNGEWEVTAGQKVSPRALNILPGDGESVYRVRQS